MHSTNMVFLIKLGIKLLTPESDVVKTISKLIVLFIFFMLFSIWFFTEKTPQRNAIESRIISSVDQHLKDEGVCEIDLAVLFDDFDWDTVSIFVAGNSKQIKDALGIDTEISDGIVFSMNGVPVRQSTSFYQFPKDIPPDLAYSIDRMNLENPYYISLSKEHAVVQVQKYSYKNGTYKYSLFVSQ